MKTHRVVEVQLHILLTLALICCSLKYLAMMLGGMWDEFLASALDGGKWSYHIPVAFACWGGSPNVHCIGDFCSERGIVINWK
jgi:hypothetical protein